MGKHRKILEFAISSLMRRRFKHLGIVTVFSLVVFILSSILFLTHSFRKEALDVLKGSPELIVQRVTGGRHGLIPLRYGLEIKEIPGVGEVIPRYWGYYYDTSTGANYTILSGEGKPSETITMLEGEYINEGQRGVCVIGKGVSDARITGINGAISLSGADGRLYRCKVIGVFTAESTLLTNDLIILSTEDIKRLFNIPEGLATDIVVEVYNPSEVTTVARKIKGRFPDTRPITREEILRTYDTLFNWRSGLVLTMFFGTLIAFCILAWDKATGLSAEERREIGILKAIGWETSDILELKFWEGTAISTISFLTGIIAAYLHVFFFGASIFSPALKGWSVLFPEFRLMPYIDLYQISVLTFITVIPYIAATIVPSWKASITDPDVVMRG